MNTEFINIMPVLPSADIARDLSWYKQHTSFEEYFSDKMYAVLYRENLTIYLQWHADTENDPLLGGSVIRIDVKNIKALFDEFVNRGTITKDAFKTNTPWKTNEFGFFDLNKNAIFFMEDANG
ncbi:MAG: glyoxalase/bleomycin resistance/extradiol dioxygenase family protein [Chitinophagaceae bacterium]|nr:glyoxalase/bleomycin resistance/extradiol dioxygenase family protein [Chitinophagaceae bacterium]